MLACFVAAVEEFDDSLGGLTWATWVNHRVERGWPTQNGFKKHGNFTELRAAARERVKKAA